MGKADDRPVGMTVLEATSTPEALVEIARRQEYIAPLFAYLDAHHYARPRVFAAVRELAVSAGEYAPWDIKAWHQRVVKMQRGESRIPPWLVSYCCAAIGQAVAEVMGEAWVQRYGSDGACGGTESAPVREPRRQRAWGASRAAAAAAAVASREDHQEDHDDAA